MSKFWGCRLPDGKKRAAWAALVMFIDVNGGAWDRDPPDVDDGEAAVLSIAHNPKVVGSDPTPATMLALVRDRF